MNDYQKELSEIYNVSRDTAAMLMLCKRLDRMNENLEKLAFHVEQLETTIRRMP